MAAPIGWEAPVLKAIGARPTKQNVAFLHMWANREGVPQNIDPYNWLGTTLRVGNSHGTNGPGVQAYGSLKDGIVAHAKMLSQSNFTGIRKALMSGNPAAYRNDPELQKEFRSWSGGGYSYPEAGNDPGPSVGTAPGGSQALAGALSQGQLPDGMDQGAGAPAQDPMQGLIGFILASNNALIQRGQQASPGFVPFGG